MGIAAINSHAKSKKHIQWLQSRFTKNEAAAQSSMQEFVSSSKVLKVEERLLDFSTAADDNTPACKDDNNVTPDTEVNPTIPQPTNQ